MGRKKTDLEDRIVRAADRLFYARGYSNTGISEVVAEAKTNKGGLYSYFPAKNDLVRRYASNRSAIMQEVLANLDRDAVDLPDFFRRWVKFMKQDTQPDGNMHNGYPVANLALQTDAGDTEMQDFIRDLGKGWVVGLTLYIRGEMRKGRFPPKPGAADIARRMYLCHEGAITMWKLTGNPRYWDDALDLFVGWLRGAAAPPESGR